jgi:hypothetical protein
MIYVFLLAVCNGFEVMNGLINTGNQVYISREFNYFHKECSMRALEIYNEFAVSEFDNVYEQIMVTNDHTSGVRMRYSRSNSYRVTGSSIMTGHILSDNTWNITHAIINLDRNIYVWNTCIYIVLHELLHSIGGLYHSLVPDSIMNETVKITPDSVVLEMENEPHLFLDDISGLIYTYNNH